MGFPYNGISTQSAGVTGYRLTGWQVVSSPFGATRKSVPGKAGLADFVPADGERYIDVACNVYPQKTFAGMAASFTWIGRRHGSTLRREQNSLYWTMCLTGIL
ncbi:MAG: hypothetical protein ACLVHV_06365 [Oscillospiraceae bacterium]